MGATVVYSKKDGQKFAGDSTLVVVTCVECHMTYAIPESLKNAALRWRGDRKDGRGWKLSCPVGHTWWYVGETDVERAQRLLNEQCDETARVRARLDQTKQEVVVQKRRASRFKNDRDRERELAHAGVCPVKGCRRHFANLERHMASKHPDYERPTPE